MAGALPPLILDLQKVKQILYNLLSNAIKFTPDGGRVMVTAWVEGLNPQGVRYESIKPGMATQAIITPQAPSCLRLSVADNGIGLKPEDRERIFDTFGQIDGSYSRQQQGIGLGLTLTRQWVEHHGGRVWVESEGEGQGSTFYVTLPVAGKPATPSVIANPDRGERN